MADEPIPISTEVEEAVLALNNAHVVAPSARGRGLARALYADLFDRAGRADHHLVVCEVNITPPNLASDALHAVLGFSEVGQATIHSGTKTVRYLSRPLVRPGRTFSS